LVCKVDLRSLTKFNQLHAKPNHQTHYFMRLVVVFILFSFFFLVGCKEPTIQPTEQERVTALLTSGTGKWVPKSGGGITTQDIDVTADLFKDFTIRFTATQIFTTGTTPVWLRQDTWQFKGTAADVIIRGQDDQEITIQNISATELVLTLVWNETTFEGGRTRSLQGEYEFVLSK
jgi:hypothetical protein